MERKGAGVVSRPIRSAVVELPDGLLRTGYHHSAALDLNEPSFFRRLVLVGFAKALPTEQENFGVFYQAVGDSCRDGGVVKNVAPIGEGRIGGDDDGSFMAVASGDDLIEEVGGLLIE